MLKLVIIINVCVHGPPWVCPTMAHLTTSLCVLPCMNYPKDCLVILHGHRHPLWVMCCFAAKSIPLPTWSARQTNTSNVSRPRSWVETTHFLFMCWLPPEHGCYTFGGWAISCHHDDASEMQAVIWGPGGGRWIWAVRFEHGCDGWVYKLTSQQVALDGFTLSSYLGDLHMAGWNIYGYGGAVDRTTSASWGITSVSPGVPQCPEAGMRYPAACRWYPGVHKPCTHGYPVPKLVVSNCVDHTQYIACFKISFMSENFTVLSRS